MSVNHEFVFRHEEIHDIYSFVEETAAVASEVDDETFEFILRLHLEESLHKFFGSVFGKLIKNDVGDTAIKNGIIRNIIDFDFLAGESLCYYIFLAFTFYFKGKF